MSACNSARRSAPALAVARGHAILGHCAREPFGQRDWLPCQGGDQAGALARSWAPTDRLLSRDSALAPVLNFASARTAVSPKAPSTGRARGGIDVVAIRGRRVRRGHSHRGFNAARDVSGWTAERRLAALYGARTRRRVEGASPCSARGVALPSSRRRARICRCFR